MCVAVSFASGLQLAAFVGRIMVAANSARDFVRARGAVIVKNFRACTRHSITTRSNSYPVALPLLMSSVCSRERHFKRAASNANMW